ncbi:MAG: hypothetical protein L6W00_15085 [Lentisphaeria bacterium]|nr:MAG: hypothetical protein L6W00_15085 [Lentisphaeria bacterium]
MKNKPVEAEFDFAASTAGNEEKPARRQNERPRRGRPAAPPDCRTAGGAER